MNDHKKHGPPKPEVEYNNPGIIRAMSTSQLTSGLPYQRPVVQRDVDRIIREWDPRKLTPVIVSFRDGKFNVVDGQHHIEAMRQMAGGRDVIVPCMIYTDMTYEDEAALYASLDTDKTALTPRQHAKAVVEAGSDPKITETKRLAEEAGFTWALDKQTGMPFEIAAVRSLVNAYQLLGGEGFARMLALLAGTWHGTPNSLKASMLSGMALFVKTYEPELSDRAFIRRMSAVSPEDIIRQGRLNSSASLRYARIIWEHYNGQRLGGPELPYRFKR